MTTTNGIFVTSNLHSTIVKTSFAGMITRLMPHGHAPLFALTSMLASETAVQKEHGFFSKTMVFPYLKLNGAIGDATTNVFVVDDTSSVVPNMVMRAESTGEMIIVNNVISSTQVQVTRGIGSVAAAAIADDVELYQIGNAFEEASTRPQARAIDPVWITNYTQIFRDSWALSESTRATQVIAGNDTVSENKQDCAAFHANAIEAALIFGQKSTGTRNGQPFRMMAGIERFVATYASSNITTAGSTTNYTQLEAALDPVFNQTTDPKIANERVLFVGGTAKKVINNIGRLNGTYNLVDGQTSFGLQFSSFKTTRGTFRLIEHPLFNTNASWSKLAIAVDLSTFNIAYLGDRKTQNREFNTAGNQAQDNGIDAVGGTLTTECTALVKNAAANAIIWNLTAGAAG
jgi:hypothetical protein